MQRSMEPGKRRRNWGGAVSQAALLGGVAALIGGGAWALPTYPTATTSNSTTPTYVGDPTIGVSAVNLTAPRTIIDWLSFSIAPGETLTFNANARSDIVLNRLSDPSQAQINGTLNSLVGTQSGGNVWIAAPAGVIFGPNAVVNVGGLLATTANLTDVSDFLDPTKSSFNFQFNGQFPPDPTGTNPEIPYYGGVVVQSGASLSTSKGLLALVAPFVTVQSGAAVGDANTGDVLLGGATGYTITLGQETAGDLDLLEYQVPLASGSLSSFVPGGDTPVAPAITVAGAVTGKNVFVTALSLQSLTNAIVTDTGSITATGAVQQGDGTVILTADTFDLVPANFPTGTVFDPTLGVAPTSGSNQFLPQYVTPFSFGAINAPQTYIHGGGLVNQAAGTAIAGGGAQISGGDIALSSNALLGAVNLTGGFQATAEPLAAAQYTNVGASPPGGTVSASGAITANDIAIQAAANVTVGALSATGGAVTVSSDTGLISTGALTASGAVTVNAPGGGIETAAVNAGGALNLTAGGTPGLSFNGFVFTGDLTAGGAVNVNAPNGGMSVGAVNAGGALTLTAGGAPNSGLSGYVEATSLTAAGAVTVNGYSIFTGAVTGQSVTMTAGSGGAGVSTGDVTATGGPLTLTAASGNVNPTSVTGAGAVTLTSSNGPVAVGTAPSSDTGVVSFTPGPVTGQSVTISANTDVTAGVVQATAGPLTASAANGNIILSSAAATGALALAAPNGTLSVGTDVLAADGITVIGFNPGAVSGQNVAMSAINGITVGNATATGGTLTGSATNGAIDAEILQATGAINVAGASIDATAANAGGAASLIAAPGSSSAPGSASVTLGSLSATQALVQAGDGPVVITSANLGSGGLAAHALGTSGDIWLGYASPGTGGTGTLAGSASLYAAHNVNVDTSGAANLAVVNAANQANLTSATGSLTLGTVTVTGALTAAASQGSISLTALQQAGLATFSAGSDMTLGVTPAAVTGSAVAGRDLSVTGAGALDLTGFSMTAGRNASLSSPNLLTIAGLTATGAASIIAGDLNLTGALTAPTVTIASLTGPLTLGGTGTGTGLVLDSTEFGRITAFTALNLYAGSPSATARGDLTVQALALDPAKVPTLNLYAASGQTVSVTGVLAPTSSGGAVAIGGLAGWTPTTILVSGGLGTATRVSDTQFTGVQAFGQVSLNALGDVLLGSPRFVGLVQAAAPDQINLALNLPAGVQPQGAEIGRVYLASGRLAVTAGGKVVGQNTEGGLGGYAGVYLTNAPGAPGVVLTLDPPSVVDLFGSYVNRTGALSSGLTAAVGPDLSVLGTGARQNYRFNSCVIGVGCSSSAVPGPAQGLQPLNGLQAVFVSDATDASEAAGEGASAADSAEAASAPGARVQPPTFGIVPSAGADPQADPVVTGTGNEEIWRKRGGNAQ